MVSVPVGTSTAMRRDSATQLNSRRCPPGLTREELSQERLEPAHRLDPATSERFASVGQHPQRLELPVHGPVRYDTPVRWPAAAARSESAGSARFERHLNRLAIGT
jgi:hypothetical protein